MTKLPLLVAVRALVLVAVVGALQVRAPSSWPASAAHSRGGTPSRPRLSRSTGGAVRDPSGGRLAVAPGRRSVAGGGRGRPTCPPPATGDARRPGRLRTTPAALRRLVVAGCGMALSTGGVVLPTSAMTRAAPHRHRRRAPGTRSPTWRACACRTGPPARTYLVAPTSCRAAADGAPRRLAVGHRAGGCCRRRRRAVAVAWRRLAAANPDRRRRRPGPDPPRHRPARARLDPPRKEPIVNRPGLPIAPPASRCAGRPARGRHRASPGSPRCPTRPARGRPARRGAGDAGARPAAPGRTAPRSPELASPRAGGSDARHRRLCERRPRTDGPPRTSSRGRPGSPRRRGGASAATGRSPSCCAGPSQRVYADLGRRVQHHRPDRPR